MTQTGTVERRLEGGLVLLSVARQTACGHDCENCAGCGVQAGRLEVRAVDRIGVSPGDRVEVRSDNRKLLGMAALVYLLPVAMFLAGYLLGDVLARAGGGYSAALMRATASRVASASPKAVSRIYPSPLGPKPAPGVVTTLACWSRRSKNAQEPSPSGVLAQT